MASKINLKTALKFNTDFLPCSKLKILDSNTIEVAENEYNFNYLISSNLSHVCDKITFEYIENLFNGKDSTLFTYGQINSGKSELIGTNFFASPQSFIPRVLIELFARIDEEQIFFYRTTYSITISLIELNDGKVNYLIRNVKVKHLYEAVKLLEEPPQFNPKSHVIFTVIMQKTVLDMEMYESKFSFIDLAGTVTESDNVNVDDVKIKWDLMLLKEYLLNKLDAENTANFDQNQLVKLFDKCVTQAQVLFIACVDYNDYQEMVNIVSFSSRFTEGKFVRESKEDLNNTIECFVNWSDEDTEKGRKQPEQETVKPIECENITPVHPIKPNRICDSLEIYFAKYNCNNDNVFKVPVVPTSDVDELNKSLFDVSIPNLSDSFVTVSDLDEEAIKLDKQDFGINMHKTPNSLNSSVSSVFHKSSNKMCCPRLFESESSDEENKCENDKDDVFQKRKNSKKHRKSAKKLRM